VDASQLEAYLPLVLLVVVGYLLLIRPARRRAQAAAALQAAISPGDEVMLSSGIYGVVVALDDEATRVEISPGTVIRVHRGAVTQIIKDEPSPTDDEDERPDSAGTAGADDAGVN
jgi:preprotein translocase subunit YajC